MPKLLRHSRATVIFGPALAAAAGVITVGACTDNGDSSAHGPTFGALPKTDGGSLGPDGEVLVDGAADPDAPTGDDSGTEAGPPCTSGTIAVLAGNTTTLSAGVQSKGGAWATQAITGSAAKSKPALVAFGAGFLGVTHGPGDVLQSVSYSASWTAPLTIGTSGVKGSPALAVAGTKAHVVYSAGPNLNTDLTHGIHDGANWNAATAPVGAPPSFGTISVGLAGAGTDVVFAENGTDNGLYTRTFDAAWSASSAVVGAGTEGAALPATPEIVAITGGQSDGVLVYTEKTTRRLSFATRDGTSKVWTNGGNIHLDATTAEKVSAAQVGGGHVIVTFRGQDGKGYYAEGTVGASSVTWTASVPVGGGVAPSVDSTPAVANGVCGDDAVFTYASGGAVYATRRRGASWTPAVTIGGLTGNQVAIATRP